MTFKQLFAKSFHISRRFRMIFYIRVNRLKFWLNDVKFGQNMQVYNNLYLMKCRGSRIIVGDNPSIRCVGISKGVCIRFTHIR